MKRNPILMGVCLAALVACGDGRTGQVADEGAVPEGAVPAADDYRPEAPEAAAGATATEMDAAPDTATSARADTLTTGPDAATRIPPR